MADRLRFYTEDSQYYSVNDDGVSTRIYNPCGYMGGQLDEILRLEHLLSTAIEQLTLSVQKAGEQDKRIKELEESNKELEESNEELQREADTAFSRGFDRCKNNTDKFLY